MASGSFYHGDDWDESTDTPSGYGNGNLTDSSYHGRSLAPTPDSAYGRNGSASAESMRLPPLSDFETVEVFRNAVDAARENMHALGGNERFDDSVQLKLTIDLKRKAIESLPDEVVDIIKRDVERIVLSHNQLSYLPYRFFECSSMQYLNLRGNRFKQFPRPLLKMQKLQILDLSRNGLEVLPEEIKNMKALRVLSVMHNSLTELPFCLGNLDSLRILKMAGNKPNDALRAIIERNDATVSPQAIPIAENEKDSLLTIKLKEYLRSEAATLESGGESSSESPLDTPRPLKRNTSIRFPVVPANSSEVTPDLRSPNPAKPPVPNRSHYRMASGQNGTLQNASFRRPAASPLISSNERNRSNSESILQVQAQAQTQPPLSAKNKRMGIVKKSELGTLEEAKVARNSLHFRGTSHSSALKDRNSQIARSQNGAESGSSSDFDPSRGTFIRRLSSLPEQKSGNALPNSTIEGAKGLLFSLYSLEPYIETILSLTSDDTSKRSSLQRIFYMSSTQLSSLDESINIYNATRTDDERQRTRLLKNVSQACQASIVAYLQVGRLLVSNARQLLLNADPRYIRMLLVIIYGSTVEGSNAFYNLSKGLMQMPPMLQVDGGPGPATDNEEGVPRVAIPSITPTQERPSTTRRLRGETSGIGRSQQAQPQGQVQAQGHNKSATHPQSAVPLYINGRSRSNSRSSNSFNLSTSSSVAGTPYSGESFNIPGTPALLSSDLNGSPGNSDHNHDAEFERVFLSFKKFTDQTLSALPPVCQQFGRCYEAAEAKSENRNLVDLWQRLTHRSRATVNSCDDLSGKFATLRLNDLELRNSADFWQEVIYVANSFVNLCEEIKRATLSNKEQMAPLDVARHLRPSHVSVKAAIQNLKNSPWSWALGGDYMPAPPQPAPPKPHSQWQSANPPTISIPSRLNGHHRTRGDSGSSSSPYMPATPLSAALGPAAAATIPSHTANSNSFDRSFQGDVFQRAAFALTNSKELGQLTAFRRK